MVQHFLRSILILTLLFGGVFTAFSQEGLPDLVRRIKPSAVSIESFDARGRLLSRGSGFFVGEDRVVTNRHVIANAARVELRLMDGRKVIAGGVLSIDGEGDLALLKVDVPAESAFPLPIAVDPPEEGEAVVVVGNPFGLEGSVSNGIVSAVREIAGYGRIIQITAPISPGSSGSPVVNMRGEAVGVATLQAAEGQSLNFAVPADRVLRMRVGAVQTLAQLASESSKTKRAAAERAYSQGVAQLSRDQYERALAYFVEAVGLDAAYAEAWYQAGYAQGVLGRHSDSLRSSREAARLRPEWAAAYVNIGASSFALGKFGDAEAAYRRALQLDETNAEAQYALGLTLGRLGRSDEEALAYRRVLALRPDHANAMEKLASAYLKLKKWADAAAVLEQLKAYRPEAKTFNSLGEALIEMGRTEDAATAFGTAVNFDPELDRARFNLGRAYLKLGNPEMARAQYEILRNSRSEWADRLLVLLEN